MFSLMVILLWVGLVCLGYRHLHQTGTLTVDAMEEPFRAHMECADEDITDKV